MKRSKSTNFMPKICFQVENVKNFGVFGQLEIFSPQSWNFPQREKNLEDEIFVASALRGELWYSNKKVFATIFQARIWCHIFEAFNSSLLVLVSGV